MGYFSGPVRAEVHADYRIAIFNSYRALARTGNSSSLHKLIIFISSIGSLQCADWITGTVIAQTLSHQAIGLLNSVPAIVAIHGIKAAHNRGYATHAKFAAQCLGLFQ